MEEDYIPISTLNDFIFCPYSIYLHNVYMDTDEGLYHATPQTRGRFLMRQMQKWRNLGMPFIVIRISYTYSWIANLSLYGTV